MILLDHQECLCRWNHCRLATTCWSPHALPGSGSAWGLPVGRCSYYTSIHLKANPPVSLNYVISRAFVMASFPLIILGNSIAWILETWGYWTLLLEYGIAVGPSATFLILQLLLTLLLFLQLFDLVFAVWKKCKEIRDFESQYCKKKVVLLSQKVEIWE